MRVLRDENVQITCEMVRYYLGLLLYVVALFGCEPEDCNCVTIRDKYTAIQSSGQTRYKYTVEDCDGTRTTYSGTNSTTWNTKLIGDQFCQGDLY